LQTIVKISLVLATIATTAAAHGGESSDESFFLKLPVTSIHIGDTHGYKFNQQNLGVGIGYEHTRYAPGIGDITVAYSAAYFIDSYRCEAANLQVKSLKDWGYFAFGVSVNLAHKCVRPYTSARTIVVPLFTTAWNPTPSIRVNFDGFPPATKQYGVGFVGVSVDVNFK
jgi:hypothetical protein